MKQIYVLTEDYSHQLIGVYSTSTLAINALCRNAIGYTMVGIEPQAVGTAYYFRDDNENTMRFYIESAILDDPLWLGTESTFQEGEEE